MSEPLEQAEDTQETTEQVESTETKSEETTEQTEQTSTEETAENSDSAKSEESETTETIEDAPSEDEQYFIRNKVGDEDIVYDIRVPEQRKKLQEDAQKGIGFTKKSQALSDWQKANEPMLQFAQTVLQDETMQRALLAKQLNIDPTVAFAQTQAPDEYWKEANPAAYWQAFYQHERVTNDKARLEQGLKDYKHGLAQNFNVALVEKAKLKHELKDTEANSVIAYIQENMKPNQLGMYSETQFDHAVTALYGREKMKQEKLNQSEKFNNTMKKISKSAPAKTTKVSTEQKKLSPEEAEAKRFKDYVKEMSKNA